MDQLAAWRKRAGKTQKDVASYLDVTQPTVSAWESGDSQIPLSKLSLLARWLQVSPEDLGAALLGSSLVSEDLAGKMRALETNQEEDALLKATRLLDSLEASLLRGEPLPQRDIESLSQHIGKLAGVSDG